MKFTANTLPEDIRDLPAFAVNAFLEAANLVLEYVEHDEAVQIGRRAAQDLIERKSGAGLRTDGDGPGRRVEREERIQFRIDQGKIVRHENGWIDGWGVATRSGIFDYEDPDTQGGIFRELRPFDEVMDPASLATLPGVPFTITHPEDEVTSANTRDLAHGVVLEVRTEGDLVWARIRVWSDEAKAAIADGMIELSCGYSTVLDESPGRTSEGDLYHAIQRKIRYDHLALVDLARAGHIARLRLDGFRCLCTPSLGAQQPMKYKIRIDGKTYAIKPFLVSHLNRDHADILRKRSDAKRKGKRFDFATGAVTITPDGGEPVELVLPMATIEQIMGLLGAPIEGGEGAPAAATGETEIEESIDEGAEGAEGAPGSEKTDPAPPGQPGQPQGQRPEDAFGGRMDAKEIASLEKHIEARVDKRVDARVDKALKAERKRSDAATSRRGEVERKATRVLDSGFVYSGKTTEAIQVEVIGQTMPDRHVEAQGLGAKSSRGDAAAQAGLDMLYSIACDKSRADRQAETDEANEDEMDFDRHDDAGDDAGDGDGDGDGDGGGDGDSKSRADEGTDLDPVESARQDMAERMRSGTSRDEGDED